MYVVSPLRLIFRVNESKHTISTARQFKDPIVLHGTVKAAVHESREQAMNMVLDQVREVLKWPKFTGTTPSDFELEYSSEAVQNGLFWAGPGCYSTHRLKD